jgi:hypothetical protein
MDWSELLGNVLKTGVSLYGAGKQSDNYKAAAQQATPTPWSTTGGFGTVQSQNGQLNMQLGQSPFYPMFQAVGMSSLANAATAPGSAYYGAGPEISAAAQGLDTGAMQGTAQDRYNLLTQAAQPEEQRAFNRLEDRLFARGQMGSSGGGEAYRGFEEARQQADLQRQMMGQDFARTSAMDRFQSALQAVQAGQAGQAQQFGMGLDSQSVFQNALQGLLGQGHLGVSAGAGTPVGAALASAQARGGQYQLGNEFLQSTGAYDWLGGKLGGLFGGNMATPPFNPNAPDVNKSVGGILGTPGSIF